STTAVLKVKPHRVLLHRQPLARRTREPRATQMRWSTVGQSAFHHGSVYTVLALVQITTGAPFSVGGWLGTSLSYVPWAWRRDIGIEWRREASTTTKIQNGGTGRPGADHGWAVMTLVEPLGCSVSWGWSRQKS